MRTLTRRPALAAVALAASLFLAACGGSGSSTQTKSANYDPAKATLTAAGLGICAQGQQIVPQSIASAPGIVGARGFVVTPCKSKPQNTVIVMQFADTKSRDAVAASAKKLGEVFVYKSIVVLTTGPDAKKNSTALQAQMAKAYGSTTSG